MRIILSKCLEGQHPADIAQALGEEDDGYGRERRYPRMKRFHHYHGEEEEEEDDSIIGMSVSI
jgi:hypothetical protein